MAGDSLHLMIFKKRKKKLNTKNSKAIKIFTSQPSNRSYPVTPKSVAAGNVLSSSSVLAKQTIKPEGKKNFYEMLLRLTTYL